MDYVCDILFCFYELSSRKGLNPSLPPPVAVPSYNSTATLNAPPNVSTALASNVEAVMASVLLIVVLLIVIVGVPYTFTSSIVVVDV